MTRVTWRHGGSSSFFKQLKKDESQYAWTILLY